MTNLPPGASTDSAAPFNQTSDDEREECSVCNRATYRRCEKCLGYYCARHLSVMNGAPYCAKCAKCFYCGPHAPNDTQETLAIANRIIDEAIEATRMDGFPGGQDLEAILRQQGKAAKRYFAMQRLPGSDSVKRLEEAGIKA